MTDANKAVVKRWFNEVWNAGRAEMIEELLAPNAVIHGLGTEGTGSAAFKPFYADFRNAFPNIRVQILQMIAEGEMVAAHCRVAGAHKGALKTLAPTQRAFEFSGITIARIQNGKIVEGWNHFDFMDLYKQLGMTQIP